MDCRDAQTLLSAHHDGDPMDAGALEAARAHCATCAECAAFAGGLDALARVPAPAASEDLVARVTAAVAAEREADARAASAAEEAAAASDVAATAMPAEAAPAPAPDGQPPVAVPSAPTPAPGGKRPAWLDAQAPAWITPTRMWASAGVVVAAAAALVVGLAFVPKTANEGQLAETTKSAVDQSLRSGATAGSSAPAYSAAGEAATKPASPHQWISFNGGVYSLSATSQEVTASQLATAGTVVTALGGTDAPAPLTVFRWTADQSAVVLRTGGDALQVYTPVVRTFGGASFQLMTGTDLTRFTDWPRMPAGVTEPNAADGSPALTAGAKDDLGVTVFPRIGDTGASGFAIAPNPPATDPVAGDPYWSWWAPLR